MIVRFNKAQLGRDMEKKMDKVLASLQEGKDVEVEVIALEFPYKFSIQVGDDVSILAWNPETDNFEFADVPVDSAETETIPESKKDTVDLPVSSEPEPEPQTKSTVDPVELAQRTFVQVNDFMDMVNLSPEQLVIYNETYSNLWAKRVKESK